MTSLESWWMYREIIPKWAARFRLVNYYNLPIYIYIHIIIYYTIWLFNIAMDFQFFWDEHRPKKTHRFWCEKPCWTSGTFGCRTAVIAMASRCGGMFVWTLWPMRVTNSDHGCAVPDGRRDWGIFCGKGLGPRSIAFSCLVTRLTMADGRDNQLYNII